MALATWREIEAIRLRLQGIAYADIAAALGYATKSSAWKAVNRALKRQVDASARAYLEQLSVDLTVMQDASWAAACRGDTRALALCLRAIDMRATLLSVEPRRTSAMPRCPGECGASGLPQLGACGELAASGERVLRQTTTRFDANPRENRR